MILILSIVVVCMCVCPTNHCVGLHMCTCVCTWGFVYFTRYPLDSLKIQYVSLVVTSQRRPFWGSDPHSTMLYKLWSSEKHSSIPLKAYSRQTWGKRLESESENVCKKPPMSNSTLAWLWDYKNRPTSHQRFKTFSLLHFNLLWLLQRVN